MEKKFDKFFIASLKRIAQCESSLLRRKQKLEVEISDRQAELESIKAQLSSFDAPIVERTGGFTVEDLVIRVVEVTDKVDKNGKPMTKTTFNLKYPDTIIPPVDTEATEPADTETIVPDTCEDCGCNPSTDFEVANAPMMATSEVPDEVWAANESSDNE